jgi:hypothetical protein
MSEIIFAKTRYQYDSYTDFYSLVSLSNFPTCYIDEVDWNRDALYITAPMNGELKSMTIPKDRKCKIALWNLERPSGSGGLQNYIEDNNILIAEGMIDQVIVSDKQLARDTGFHYVPVGGHPGLGELCDEKIYDVVHMMCYSPRRGRWFDYPNSRQYVEGITVAPNGWGDERHKSLRHARFALNIHQDEYKYMEPLRFVLAACYGLPIISEDVTDWWPYVGYYQAFRLGDEVETIKRILRNPDYWQVVSRELRNWMTEEWTFRKALEAHL